MAASDPVRRSEAARLAVLTRWSRETDRTAASQAARDALMARFDPGPGVPEPQRSKMQRAGLEAHMLRMRMKRRNRAREAAERAADQLVTELADDTAEAL